MRVAIACGGTGGHLFPGLAVAEALHRHGHEALLLVSPKQIDATALAAYPQFRAQSLPGAGFPGLWSPRIFPFAGKLFQAWSRCQEIFEEFKPDAVLGMGGFTCAVPLLAGRKRKLPTLIHESNAIPGRVTRLISRKVSKVLLGFAPCARYLPGASCIVTGTPVRQGLIRHSRVEAAERFGLNPDAQTIFITGGSQGAHGLNEVVMRTLPEWKDRRDEWQFIHLTGDKDANLCEVNYRRQKMVALVKAFSPDMDYFYSLADLVIARAGAASLTEISSYGLPSILVPYPAAAEDHQMRNAEIFEQARAALVRREAQLTPELLNRLTREILGDRGRWEAMQRAARGLDQPTAAERVAEEVVACN
jgi:UDP-N-acetylglucosamine--N-acetylmuramyl-(pentapeptide) pyrophosphoryl-undecaprenol N-acetylglucosamine transferase